MAYSVLDPHYLDEAALRVRLSGQRVVNLIRDTRARLDTDGKNDVPLVAIIGETHAAPAQMALAMEVLDGLTRAGPAPVFAYEDARSGVYRSFARVVCPDAPVTARQREMLDEHNSDGRLSLLNRTAYVRSLLADHTQLVLFNALEKRGIATCFNDAARCGKDCLDKNDPRVARIMETCGADGMSDDVSSRTPLGMYLRNVHMAQEGLRFAAAQKARVVVQMCGVEHVVGKVPHMSGAQSLAPLYKAEGAAVLAFPIEVKGSYETHDIPPDHGLHAGEIHMLEGVPQDEAVYHPCNPHAIPQKDKGALSGVWDEAPYINSFLTRNGHEDCRIQEAEAQTVRQARQQEINRIFKSIGAGASFS